MTTSKTTMSLKVDKTLKQDAEAVAERIGLPLGTVINGFLRTFVREERVEFIAPNVPNKHLESYIAEARREYAAGDVSDTFTNAADFAASLDV